MHQNQRRTLAIITALLGAMYLCACGGTKNQRPPSSVPNEESSERRTPSLAVEPGAQHLAVPSPPMGRARVHRDLQRFWSSIEDMLAVGPPKPPEEASQESIAEWAKGSLMQWLEKRREALNQAVAEGGWMKAVQPEERAMAAGLYAYAYEDTASAINGAPVPEAVAKDEELLSIYKGALQEFVSPIAQLSVEAYVRCKQGFVDAQATTWIEWLRYCDSRGADLRDTYQLMQSPEEESTP